jgi:hypothetical protein
MLLDGLLQKESISISVTCAGEMVRKVHMRLEVMGLNPMDREGVKFM